MKDFTRLLLLCLALVLMGTGQSLFAQSSQDEGKVVIQKITHDDGSTTLVKKRIQNAEDVGAYVETLQDADGEVVEIRIMDVDDEGDRADENTMVFIRKGKSCDQKKDGDHSVYHWKGNTDYNYSYSYSWSENGRDRSDRDDRPYRHDRPLIGIYPGGNSGQGLRVNSIVNGGGAEAAGLQDGDVITDVNGNAINGLADLRVELSKYNAGDQVRVNYEREGQNYSTMVTLKKRTTGANGRELCSVFIGVSLGGDGPDGKGIRITGTIGGFPASKEDIQRGDVIVAFDGVEVNSVSELQTQRDKHDLGETFNMTLLRDGQLRTVTSKFNSCEEEPQVEPTDEPVEVEKVPEVEEFTEEEIESVPEIDIDNELMLDRYTAFPNPTFGRVRVQFAGEAVATTIQITDMNGKVVHREQINRFDGYYDKELNLDNAAPGTLIVTIRQGDKMTAKKIVLMSRV